MAPSAASGLPPLSAGFHALLALSAFPRIGHLPLAESTLFRAHMQAFCKRHPGPSASDIGWHVETDALAALEALCRALRLRLVDPLADSHDAAIEDELVILHDGLLWALDGPIGVFALEA
jgi:hypothetical protein